MSQVMSTNQQNFETEVLKSEIPVLVDFYAEWCGPCKMMAPVIDKIAQEMQGTLKVVKLDTDHSPAIANQYGIMGVPTLIMFKDGKPIGKNVGYMNEQAMTGFVKSSIG